MRKSNPHSVTSYLKRIVATVFIVALCGTATIYA